MLVKSGLGGELAEAFRHVVARSRRALPDNGRDRTAPGAEGPVAAERLRLPDDCFVCGRVSLILVVPELDDDQIARVAGFGHDAIENTPPIPRPISHGGFAELLGCERQDDTAPDSEPSGLLKGDEVGAARSRTD